MCFFAVQIIYGIIGTAVLGLTITSLALDSWTQISDKDYSGLLCPSTVIEDAIKNHKSVFEECHFDFSQFMNISPYQQAILIAIILAIVAEVCCLTYNFFTACACCCKTILLPILFGLSVIATILLAIAVGVFLKENPNRMAEIEKFEREIGKHDVNDLLGMGNSFIFAACALAGAVINTLVSLVAWCCAATLI
ncbi:hypothetical protein PMAYCL1PPCAC_23221 [Pristionchus mayeri]|uniref:Uncharacterized protein n=1 Tax=Pristionchus mayeri TaxID=1317129 RepID=A0AAN5I783_9BILA|nr:hypothetical protein PMAYCL1PPCAC_23221 [Pristionchus mayeri]